jgi:HK97 gp10 family phage protein
MEKYLEDLAAAGRDVDAAAGRALAAGGEVALQGMQRRVPQDTKNLAEHLATSQPKKNGNFVYVDVGILQADADTARYGNAQEFGTSSMPAQPYIRPTLAEDKGAISKAMRDSLKEEGLA